MLVELCQVDSASTVPPLLLVFVPDISSGLGRVGSSFKVASLTMSGLRVSDETKDIPGGEVISNESPMSKVSDSVGVGVGVSNVSGFGVSKTSLSVSLVLGESGCLVLLGEPNVRSATRVCGIDGIRSQVCAPCPFKYGVDGDHRPFVVDLTDLTDRGAGGVVSSKVVGALVEGSPMVKLVEDACLSKLTGDLVCWSILFVLFGCCFFC